MNLYDINGKYLLVGYNKRKNEPQQTERYNRNPMGRKGIGKLSVFAIADVVEVYTVKQEERHALKLDALKIENAIGDEDTGGVYTPEELDDSVIDFQRRN